MLPSIEPYFIGETALHHEGDFSFLIDLINNGVEIGFNALKFHLIFNLDDYMVLNHDAIEIVRPWCFSKEQWTIVIEQVSAKDIDIVFLCNDVSSLDWVLEQGNKVTAIELHATGVNDYFLLDKASLFHGTVILGVGGSTLDEVQYAIDILKGKGKSDIFLMYGFQSYPTDFKDINLSKINKLRNLFNLPVGYADHTDPLDEDNASISILATSLGCNVLEKHYTHRPGEKRTDSQAAVSLSQISNIKRKLYKAISTYGSGGLQLSNSEIKYGDTGPMKKAIVARHKILKGQELSLENIAFKRTNGSTYVKQYNLINLLGLKALEDIAKDTIIDFNKVDYKFIKTGISQFQNTDK